MAFHFTSLTLDASYYRFRDFHASVFGGGSPFPLGITVFSQPLDRYSKKLGIEYSAVIYIAGYQLPLLPLDYDGFIVERSHDGGSSWGDVSGVVRGGFYFVDSGMSPGVFLYRVKMRLGSGLLSDAGDEVSVTIGSWEDIDDLGVTEINSIDGEVQNRLSRDISFPLGFSGDAHAGMGVSEGSIAGGYSGGSWYLKTQETEPPVIFNYTPLCGSGSVSYPLTQIVYQIQDKPYNSSGSGIDDNSYSIFLSVSSQYGGVPILIRQGTSQPSLPLLECVITVGVNVDLDRNVIINVPAGYIGQGDIVIVTTSVADVDQNVVQGECSFVMESIDVEPPVISNQSPECGLGVEDADERYAARDTSFSFKVTDLDSGVDVSSLQVSYGLNILGPWTLLLNNGSVFLGGFTGSVVSDGVGGYDVVIRRPVGDPLWDEDVLICFKIEVSDLLGNDVEEVCCFKVEAASVIKNVVPIAEDILYVEFSREMENSQALRDVDNYSIVGIKPAGISPVVVRSVMPQFFIVNEFGDLENNEYGEGFPRAVFLNMSTNSFWGEYRLEVNGENVRDKFGISMGSTGRSLVYRARRTKIDEGRDVIDIDVSRSDSLMRRFLIALMNADEYIGGTFTNDDWEER